MPVGRCVTRTAESVVLTDWPPGPVERMTSILMSLALDVHVDVLGLGQDGDGHVEVWMRPCDSVSGTRCTRCTPDSHLKTE